ncbi:hypothetical protein H2201_006629 [Coniosporium apollinis]|uniref:Uncharacterized protein n=1 Tax=Coniosporium apollinis TaxID=61459 RepID=A0ABQ9NQC6_9PEZI|nr:hypothetical protein H2201_006629 [Coniosporium apollinis]
MSISRTSSGGVRSLRAMFESSKTSTSDSQSLTPGDNRTNETDTPRSASKVRASFVPVESSTPVKSDSAAAKDNINGHNSTADQRRESFSLDESQDAEDIADLQRTVTHEKEKRKQSADVREVIPEQAIEPTPAVTPAHEVQEDKAMGAQVNDLGNKVHNMHLNDDEAVLNTLGLPKANSNADLPTEDTDVEQLEQNAEDADSPAESPGDNPDKPVSAVEDTEATMKPADPKDEGSVSGGAALPQSAEKLSPLKHNKGGAGQAAAPFGGDGTMDEDPPASTPGKTPDKVNGIAMTPMHSQAKPAPSKTPSSRPPAISTAREASTKVSSKTAPMPKSPAGMPKTPKTPTSVHQASPPKSAVSKPSPKPSLARDTKPSAPAPKTSRSSLRASTSSTATAPTAASKTRAAAKPTTTAAAATNHTSPTTSKPTRPKSPTRPVRLPSHLTAPTASSAAKHDTTAAPTRTAASTTTAAGSNLGRKPSTLTRDRAAPSKPTAAAPRKEATRPSLNASQGPKRPESRTGGIHTTKAADEGFLARMMRPTASSSSKAHEKVEAKSPPRRAASVRPKVGGAGAGGAGRAREKERARDKEGVKTNGTAKEGAPVLPDVAGVDATGGADAGGMEEVDGVGAR